jgi:hypothetical protein
MEPMFRKLYVDMEKAEDRIKIYTVGSCCFRAGMPVLLQMDHVPGLQIDGAKLSDEQRRPLPLIASKPLFVVFKVSLTPASKIVASNDRKCKHVCNLQSKVIIAKIPGANGPELESTILDNAPAVNDE